MLLSILIPTVPSRKKVVQNLLTKLEKMIDGYNDVQILCLYDNKSVTTGAKRQKLVNIADGQYIQFVDDDDELTDDYLDSVYPALVQGEHDLITFGFHYSDDLGVERDYPFDDLQGTANHTHLWRKSAITSPYPDYQVTEDRFWVEANLPHIGSRYHIPKTLYNYRYDSKKTETQK